ncbi:MAG: hypothetical protein IIA44_02610 [Acidobacteria bacterium]|nr:hypothetical protein [Acidobacteriota bacterium]
MDTTEPDVHGNGPIFAGDDCVGVMTSGGYGHATHKSLGFGYVTPDLASAGTELDIALLGDRYKARVLKDPVYDPANERLRA